MKCKEECNHPAVDFWSIMPDEGSTYYCLECYKVFTLNEVVKNKMRIEHSIIYNREK